MKLDASFPDVLKQLEKDRGIPVADLKAAIESAFLSAYKKKYGVKDNILITLSPDLTEIQVKAIKKVVEDVTDDKREISYNEALELNPEIQLEEEISTPVDITGKEFGRLAAQVAKQVITQKLREAEKKQVYDEYHDRKGQIVTGVVQRLEKNNIIVKLGKHEAVLMPSEQVPGEKFRVGDRLKLYLVELQNSLKGTHQILLSRSNPGFVQKLFEIEVPEISEGTVLIKSISREAGYRTKIAVATSRGNADPVGACIGSRGARIKAIMNELMGEKIDIVRWSSNNSEFIANALSPAKVLSVKIIDKEKCSAYVVVPDDQLSLAIGRDGQNVRLAARLTNFHIDIESESQAKALRK